MKLISGAQEGVSRGRGCTYVPAQDSRRGQAGRLAQRACPSVHPNILALVPKRLDMPELTQNHSFKTPLGVDSLQNGPESLWGSPSAHCPWGHHSPSTRVVYFHLSYLAV